MCVSVLLNAKRVLYICMRIYSLLFYIIILTFRSIQKTKQESMLNKNYVVKVSENMEHTNLNWAIFLHVVDF